MKARPFFRVTIEGPDFSVSQSVTDQVGGLKDSVLVSCAIRDALEMMSHFNNPDDTVCELIRRLFPTNEPDCNGGLSYTKYRISKLAADYLETRHREDSET